MRPHVFADYVVRPALALVPPRYGAPSAVCLLTAIAIQETDLQNRYQIGADGGRLTKYGRGRFQHERPTVQLILDHPALGWVRSAVEEMDYPLDADVLHDAVADNDMLSVVLGRGLLAPDAAAFPEPVYDKAAMDAGMDIYERVWGPGHFRPGRWARSWALAVEATTGVQIVANPFKD